MREIIVCVGIPASGKTTFSKKWVAEDPDNRFRVSRDDLRTMSGNTYSKETQDVINSTEVSIVEKLAELTNVSIIVDSTNRKIDQVDLWHHLAQYYIWKGVSFSLKYLIFDTPLDICLERNSHRLVNKVPEDMIMSLKEDYDKTKQYLLTKKLLDFESIKFYKN